METQGSPTFELGDDEAYAGIRAKVWHAIRFFIQLKSIPFEELPAGDHSCPICQQTYGDVEKENTGCMPVQLPCSHIMGRVCIGRWITPLGGWKELNNQWEEDKEWFRIPFIRFTGSADCPICRRVFFDKPIYWESGKGLEARLLLWDRAYKRAGQDRSEKEELSRADLTKYIEFYRQANGVTNLPRTDSELRQRWRELEAYHAPTRGFLFDFVLRQKDRTLNPHQPRLRWNLDLIAQVQLGLQLSNPFFYTIKNYPGVRNIDFAVRHVNREEGLDFLEDLKIRMYALEDGASLPDDAEFAEEA